MIRRFASASATLAGVLVLATPGSAQFRVDLAPSAFRAALQPPKATDDPVPNRMNALSPLGGRQGTPVNKPVTSAAAPVKAYAGVPVDAGTDSLHEIPGIGVTGGKVENSAVEDPNKPRRPLKPDSLKKGVAPRF